MKIIIEDADARDFQELANLARQGKIHTFCMTDEEDWIPTSARSPEKDGTYLVTTDGTYNFIIDIAHYTSGKWHKESKILAWQPLPKPYKSDT